MLPTAAAAETMVASWYGPGFHGNLTANGERYNQWANSPYTAAHKTLPFGTRLAVTRNGVTITVCINDRGPFIAGRHLDLNRAAAAALGLIGPGVAPVNVRTLGQPSNGCQ